MNSYTDGMKNAGGRFASGFERLQSQLGKVTEMFHQTQLQLRSCEEEFQRYEMEFSECLDKMNDCERSLAGSQHELRRSMDDVERFRGTLKKELPRLQSELAVSAKTVVAGSGTWGGSIATGAAIGSLLGPIGTGVGYGLGVFFGAFAGAAVMNKIQIDHYEKKAEVERYEGQLSACDETLLECTTALQGYKTALQGYTSQLQNLKKDIHDTY